MDEVRLLLFRWGNEEYGIPVENVIGIAGNKGVNPLSIPKAAYETSKTQDETIAIQDVAAGLNLGSNKIALIIHSNGVQVSILVDEIIKVTRIANVKNPVPGINIATFNLWQFKK